MHPAVVQMSMCCVSIFAMLDGGTNETLTSLEESGDLRRISIWCRRG